MDDLDYREFMELEDNDFDPGPPDLTDDDYDFEDVDCRSCGLKFYVRPSLYGKGQPWPTECERCRKGLAPLYEY